MSDSFLKDASQPALIVTGGPLEGTVLTLEQSSEKVIGSGPDCHLRIPAENVAALHARVAWGAHGLMLTDGGGATGTFVNGEKAGASQPLRDGDRVSLGPPGSKGSVKLLVRVPPGAVFTGGDNLIVLDTEGPAPVSTPSPRTAVAPEPPKPATARESSAPAQITATPAAPERPAVAERPAPERRRRPEYTSDMPSIVDDRVRERSELPPMMETALRTKVQLSKKATGFALPVVPRTVVVGVATALLAGSALLVYLWLRPPRPVVTSVTPARAEPGQSVTVTGTGFDSSAAGNTIRFGTEPGQVTSASPTQLSVVVPSSLAATGAANLQVSVETRGGASNALFLMVYRGPLIATLQPDVAMPGDEIVLGGQNLSGQPLTVTFGGVGGDVTSADASGLKVKVPNIPMNEGQTVNVQVQVGSEASPPFKLILGRLPLVTEVAPTSGRAGDRVTLKGKGFDAEASGNVVQFGFDRAMVLSASPNELVVVAPAPSNAGSQVQGRVVVQARGRTSSSGRSFTVVRPSTATFLPRYFPAFVTEHPGHDHVFVSTELGPAFLLSGKADASSTVERAVRASSALNALVDGAGSKHPAVDVRDTSVAVSGGPVLVTATAEDATAYAEGWEGARGAPVTPRSLAAYWAAVIRDHLALFVERQRPHFVLELSPRGKALLDIYAEAGRRIGAGNGVPPSLVSPLPASQAKALREMALLLPAPGQASAAAGVTGSWEGSMDERGVGPRSIRVRLEVQGGHLGGTMATKAGKIAMEVPLKSVTYDKGVLTFVLTSGGAARRFSGAIEGGSIDGTIQEEGRGGEAVGRFTLRYIE